MSKKKPNRGNSSSGKNSSNNIPPIVPPRPRFREVKRQLDTAPKADPMQDKVLISCLAIIVLAGVVFLLIGFIK
jgi:hypothetical protein